MSAPFRENLETHRANDGATWIRCVCCQFLLCSVAAPAAGVIDCWRDAARQRVCSPLEAGPIMSDRVEDFRIHQLLCPGCGALLDTQLVKRAAER